jgi:hypothetical protein
MSSEKNDMSRQKNDIRRPHLRVVQPYTDLKSPLRCVWTNHPDHDHNCRARITARAVTEAWRRELALGRTRAGFFHFAWRGDVWLAYGLPDGRVRGVYCPVHRAEREQRLGYDHELVLDFDHDSGSGLFSREVSSAALADAG